MIKKKKIIGCVFIDNNGFLVHQQNNKRDMKPHESQL